jgi:hypothetical protein
MLLRMRLVLELAILKWVLAVWVLRFSMDFDRDWDDLLFSLEDFGLKLTYV